jgi:hypothetical protein
MLELRNEYYTEATEAERNLVAVLLVDRKLLRLDCVRRIRPDLMADSVAMHVLATLKVDAFAGLADVMLAGGFVEIATAITDSFWWLVEWYASEVQRFIELRLKLLELNDFRLEFCD